ncbi:MAG: hypothetical protein K2X87_18630 [Gemmataceae bacterium]|nr:hypothetical protein [Gemmataceae bacterium]
MPAGRSGEVGRNAVGGRQALYQIDPGRVAQLAAAGVDCERLPANLSPSRQRYSCLLTARRAA